MTSVQQVSNRDWQLQMPSRTAETGRPEMPAGMESKLNSFLESQGLTEEQITAFKADMDVAAQSVFESGTFPPDPEQMQSAFGSVFEKYGIDGDAFAAERLRPTSSSSESSSGCGQCYQTAYSTESLLEMLKLVSASLGDSTTSSQQDSSEYLSSLLQGIDVLR